MGEGCILETAVIVDFAKSNVWTMSVKVCGCVFDGHSLQTVAIK